MAANLSLAFEAEAHGVCSCARFLNKVPNHMRLAFNRFSMLWHKPIIVELALDFSAALRVKVDWPLATKPYDAEPDFSESYAA